MHLIVNGKPFEGQSNWNLGQLLEQVAGVAAPDGTAVAVNEEVIPRGAWSETTLAEGDRVEILGAVSGG